jgi:hypothetical protein
MNTGSTGFFIVGEPGGYLLLGSGDVGDAMEVRGRGRGDALDAIGLGGEAEGDVGRVLIVDERIYDRAGKGRAHAAVSVSRGDDDRVLLKLAELRVHAQRVHKGRREPPDREVEEISGGRAGLRDLGRPDVRHLSYRIDSSGSAAPGHLFSLSVRVGLAIAALVIWGIAMTFFINLDKMLAQV